MQDSYHWLDVERIGEELADLYPEKNPLEITFPALRSLVEGLDGFEEQSGHSCNERILEAIQQAWIDERDP